VHRLVLWGRHYAATKSYSKIAVLCLVVELICCLERAAYVGLGGLLACRTVSWPLMYFLYTGTLPFNYLTTALTVAYLHEVLTTKSALGTMVDRTRKPLLGLSIYYFVSCWPISIVAGFNLFESSALLAEITSGLLTAGTGVTAVLLLYITIRLGRYYKKKNPQKKEKERGSVTAGKGAKDDAPPDRLKELVNRVQWSCVWLLFTTAGFVATLTPQFHTAIGWIIINYAIFVGLLMTSFLHILAYGKPPDKRKKTLPSTSSNDRKSLAESTMRKSMVKDKKPGLETTKAPLLNATTNTPAKSEDSEHGQNEVELSTESLHRMEGAGEAGDEKLPELPRMMSTSVTEPTSPAQVERRSGPAPVERRSGPDPTTSDPVNTENLSPPKRSEYDMLEG